MHTHTQIILFKEILFSEPETWYRPSLSFVTINEVAGSTVMSVSLLTKARSKPPQTACRRRQGDYAYTFDTNAGADLCLLIA